MIIVTTVQPGLFRPLGSPCKIGVYRGMDRIPPKGFALASEHRALRLHHGGILLVLLLLSVAAAASAQSQGQAAAIPSPVPNSPVAVPGPEVNEPLASRPLVGALFGEIQLRDLPGSGSLWTLIETADEMTIVDRIENGGLYLGEPKLMGSLGSSWTQTGFTFDGLDLTNPARTGTPLAYLDPQVLESVRVITSLPPVDVGGGGPTVALMPRAPARTFGGHLQAAVLPSAWQAASGSTKAPAIASFDGAGEGSLLLSGPAGSDGSGFLLSGKRGVARRFERGDPTRLENRLTSLFARSTLRSSSGAQFSVVAGTDAVTHPFAGRLRFPNRDASATDQYWHAHAVWENAAAGGAWSFAAGYSRGVLGAPDTTADAPTIGVVERLLDGPVMEAALPTSGVEKRFNAVFRLRPDLRRGGGRQTLDLGASMSRTTSSENAMGPALIGELVDGLPARAWSVSWGGTTTLRHGTELAAWLNDRIDVSSRLLLEAGARVELTRAAARDNPTGVSWQNFLPRATLQFNLTSSGSLSFRTGYALIRHRLPLDDLAYGDASAPSALVYRWTDANGDRRLQPAEVGPLVAKAGPGIGSIDPSLLPPLTGEFAVGFQARFSPRWRGRLLAIERRQRRFIAPVNVGVTAADYTERQILDRGNDFFNPVDDRLLSVYDRKPASFGQDRLLLTNPSEHTGYQVGVDLALERVFDGRWHMLFAASAQRSDGYAANPGFHASENDTGVLGELFTDPNAQSYARGRLFFERGYIIKWSGGFVTRGGVHFGAVARYQDGQHFARMVIVPDLNQGPEAIQAYTRGHSRFTFTFTLDARLEKRFRVGARGGFALVGEAFNLLNNAIEVEEDPVVTREFRATTAVQPPRAVRLGVRIDF